MATISTSGRRSAGQGGSGAFTMNVQIEGSRALLAAFKDLGKDASNELRDTAMGISEDLAERVRASGRAAGEQAAAVAESVKAKRDRIPALSIGGNQPVTSDGTPAWRLLFGSEFGAIRRGGRNSVKSPWGYDVHAGRQGTWIFPALEDAQPRIAAEWRAAAERIAEKWNSVRTLPPRGAP